VVALDVVQAGVQQRGYVLVVQRVQAPAACALGPHEAVLAQHPVGAENLCHLDICPAEPTDCG
jgi:hypothetical protein